MDGMLLPMVLKENMEQYWMRRLQDQKAFEKHGRSVHQMFKGLERIRVGKKDGELVITYKTWYNTDDKEAVREVLPAFGITERDALDYAQRILDTPGYFHEKEEKIREEEGEDASWW